MTFFRRLRQVFRSEQSSDIGSQNKNGDSNMSAGNLMELTTCGRTTSKQSGERFFDAIASMEQTKKLVVTAALGKLFDESYFSICTLNNVMDVIGSRRCGEAYTLLHALHCVDYSKMDQDLRDRIPMLVNECLRQKANVSVAQDIAMNGVEI